jgi:hypothetical protein
MTNQCNRLRSSHDKVQAVVRVWPPLTGSNVTTSNPTVQSAPLVLPGNTAVLVPPHLMSVKTLMAEDL